MKNKKKIYISWYENSNWEEHGYSDFKDIVKGNICFENSSYKLICTDINEHEIYLKADWK